MLPSMSDYTGFFETLRLLHLVALSFQVEHVNPRGFQRMAFQLAYNLCDAVAEVSDQSRGQTLTPAQAVILCAQISAWGCFRFFAIITGIHGVLVSRLCDGMLKTEDLVENWQKEAPLESLLWILFTTNAAALTADLHYCSVPPTLMRKLLFKALKKVIKELRISAYEEFVSVLAKFPWSDHFCTSRCVILWASLSEDTPEVPEDQTMSLRSYNGRLSEIH